MFISIQELKSNLPKHTRLMGLDVGSKTIGLALSDTTLTIATPMETIKRSKFTKDANYLLQLAAEQDVSGLVIGMPYNMDGTEGPRCQSTRQFQENLAEKTNLPMALWDERMSTQAVTRTLLAADASRARRAELVDKMAAAFILQGALDAV